MEAVEFTMATEPPKQRSLNPKKTAAQGVKKATKGHGTAPLLDNTDKDEHHGDAMGEEVKTHRDSSKRRRSMFCTKM